MGMRRRDLSLGCWGSDDWEASVWVGGVGQTSSIAVAGVGSENVEGVDSVWVSGVWEGGGGNLMNWGGSLLGGQTTSLGISEGGEELGLGGGDSLVIGQVAVGDLSSLLGSEATGLSVGEHSVECFLSSSNVRCVLNWEAGGNSQDGGDDQFVHVE